MQEAERKGRINRLPNGNFDPEECVRRWWAEAHPGRQPSPGGDGYRTARAVHESYKARIAELEFKQREGDLVPRADVRRDCFEAGRKIREMLAGVGARVAPGVVGLDAAAAQQVIDDEMRRVCGDLSEVLAALD